MKKSRYIKESISALTFAKLETWDDVKEFFATHKNVLEHLKKYDGFENFLSNNYVDGNHGRVFKIKGQDKILKVTTDREEIEHAKKLQGKKFKHLINIYKVIEIYTSLAIIEAEYLYPLDVNLSQSTSGWIQEFFSDEDYQRLQQHVSDVLAPQIRDAYYEIIRKTSIDPTTVDIHNKNFMQDKQGNFKIIDL